jgi:S-adenosylmethionine hydrolase
MMKQFLSVVVFVLSFTFTFSQNKMIVFQTDFGLKDGAVSAMKGVAMKVDSSLKLFDLTHEIPAYNIWEASYRLNQTVPYWPAGTVFVSVVDPGVGTNRKCVVIKTTAGHFLVGPDNGTFTLITETEGIAEVREIDEAVNRRKGSEQSYTFHGRDVYAYTAARLAAGAITFEQVGKQLPQNVERIPYQKAMLDGNTIKGTIPAHDVQYGNIWTNIPASIIKKLNINPGVFLKVTIFENGKPFFLGRIPFATTFGDVAVGKPLAYLNSLMELSFAINQDNFAEKFHIKSGGDWTIEVSISKKTDD